MLHDETPENRERTRALVAEFRARFPETPLVVRAPGRVNLIGEHTDYNGGYVLPIAIDQDVRIAVRERADRQVRLYSVDYQAETHFSLDDIQPDPDQQWGNYVRGMAAEMLADGRMLRGMEGVVQGNVPIGSGLSSSAAMSIASGLAFLSISKEVVQPRQLAVMAQNVEAKYVGVHVGIMDPFVSRLGHSGCALFIDCLSLDYELIPIPGDEFVFVATNSRQSRELAGSAYNERRAECEEAVRVIAKESYVNYLREITPEILEQHRSELDPVIYRRARHVVTENQRVLDAVAALRANDLPRFGELMNASHESLREDYEVSSAALDRLVAAAREVEGCLGSRLTGAGFGGCTVSLVRRDALDRFREHVAQGYQADFGLEPYFYVTRPAAGAGLVVVDQ